MIRHIVLFKIKDEYKAEIPQLVENFYGMKGRIEGLVDLEAGADFLGSDRSYDVALITKFATREAFDAYQVHEGIRYGLVKYDGFAEEYTIEDPSSYAKH